MLSTKSCKRWYWTGKTQSRLLPEIVPVETLATHATPSVSIGRIRIYAMHAMRLDIIILLYWPLITPTGRFMQFYEQINMWSCIWYMVAYSVKAVLNK